MPNNLEILAYVQAIKDSVNESIKKAREREANNLIPYTQARYLGTHQYYLGIIENLEKFIKGGK